MTVCAFVLRLITASWEYICVYVDKCWIIILFADEACNAFYTSREECIGFFQVIERVKSHRIKKKSPSTTNIKWLEMTLSSFKWHIIVDNYEIVVDNYLDNLIGCWWCNVNDNCQQLSHSCRKLCVTWNWKESFLIIFCF